MLLLGAVSFVPLAEGDSNNAEKVEVDVPKGWKWVLEAHLLLAAGRLPLALCKCRGQMDECRGHCELSDWEGLFGGPQSLLASTSLRLPPAPGAAGA